MKTLHDRIIDLRNKGYPKDKAIDYAYANAQYSEYDRRNRMDKRIQNMLVTGNAIFYTFTISEEYNKEELHDQIEKDCIKCCRKYLRLFIGNRDHGDDDQYTQRIHWHVIGVPKDIPLKQEYWKYGNLDWQRSYNLKNKKIRNYIIKLSRHATKDTANRIFRSKEK